MEVPAEVVAVEGAPAGEGSTAVAEVEMEMVVVGDERSFEAEVGKDAFA
jgi:hypothetical protein